MMDDTRHSPSLYLFFIVAALLHWILYTLPVSQALQNLLDSFQKKKEREFVVEALPADGRQVIQTEQAERNDKLKDKKARYQAEFKNRVETETQSSRLGRFRSTIPGSPAVQGDGGEERLGMSDLLGSTPYEFPSDVRKGGVTVLNTDPVLYASFTNRIADEVYDPWVRFARDSVWNLGKKLESDIYITKLKIVIDKEGDITEIQTLKSCGVKELDEAPKKAFWEVERFPNPPSQMFEKDGYIHFVYEFHFVVNSSSFNIVPWTI